jgi:hypothetical protein
MGIFCNFSAVVMANRDMAQGISGPPNETRRKAAPRRFA